MLPSMIVIDDGDGFDDGLGDDELHKEYGKCNCIEGEKERKLN